MFKITDINGKPVDMQGWQVAGQKRRRPSGSRPRAGAGSRPRAGDGTTRRTAIRYVPKTYSGPAAAVAPRRSPSSSSASPPRRTYAAVVRGDKEEENDDIDAEIFNTRSSESSASPPAGGRRHPEKGQQREAQRARKRAAVSHAERLRRQRSDHAKAKAKMTEQQKQQLLKRERRAHHADLGMGFSSDDPDRASPAARQAALYSSSLESSSSSSSSSLSSGSSSDSDAVVPAPTPPYYDGGWLRYRDEGTTAAESVEEVVDVDPKPSKYTVPSGDQEENFKKSFDAMGRAHHSFPKELLGKVVSRKPDPSDGWLRKMEQIIVGYSVSTEEVLAIADGSGDIIAHSGAEYVLLWFDASKLNQLPTDDYEKSGAKSQNCDGLSHDSTGFGHKRTKDSSRPHMSARSFCTAFDCGRYPFRLEETYTCMHQGTRLVAMQGVKIGGKYYTLNRSWKWYSPAASGAIPHAFVKVVTSRNPADYHFLNPAPCVCVLTTSPMVLVAKDKTIHDAPETEVHIPSGLVKDSKDGLEGRFITMKRIGTPVWQPPAIVDALRAIVACTSKAWKESKKTPSLASVNHNQMVFFRPDGLRHNPPVVRMTPQSTPKGVVYDIVDERRFYGASHENSWRPDGNLVVNKGIRAPWTFTGNYRAPPPPKPPKATGGGAAARPARPETTGGGAAALPRRRSEGGAAAARPPRATGGGAAALPRRRSEGGATAARPPRATGGGAAAEMPRHPREMYGRVSDSEDDKAFFMYHPVMLQSTCGDSGRGGTDTESGMLEQVIGTWTDGEELRHLLNQRLPRPAPLPESHASHAAMQAAMRASVPAPVPAPVAPHVAGRVDAAITKLTAHEKSCVATLVDMSIERPPSSSAPSSSSSNSEAGSASSSSSSDFSDSEAGSSSSASSSSSPDSDLDSFTLSDVEKDGVEAMSEGEKVHPSPSAGEASPSAGEASPSAGEAKDMSEGEKVHPSPSAAEASEPSPKRRAVERPPSPAPEPRRSARLRGKAKP